MNYQETLEWMFQQLPMYQRQGKSAFKKDLTNIKAFCEHLNHPEKNFKSIHIAGTNGKGSTSHMLASVLQEAGYKVGLYTSPHLKDFRERIKCDGKEVSEEFVVEFIRANKCFLETQKLSFFEMTVAMAFQYFSAQEIDVAIVEVGLGGRLDSTNIIIPELSVITNIGLDHTQFLGNTLAEIAKEKAGIIKESIPVVIGQSHGETRFVFEQMAASKNAPVFFVDQEKELLYPLDLKGSYQQKNARTVLQCINVLKTKNFYISDEAIKFGLVHVVSNTGLKGRWQILQEQPMVICDTAHNFDGLCIVMEQLKALPKKELHIVLGVVSDKDLGSILPLFPKDARYYFCRPHIPRGKNAAELAAEAKKYNLYGKIFPSVKKAYNTAFQCIEKGDVLYVGGSTFTVAEII
ncbi:MAG: bifunctional folylpolyglutamate synthase/dihydrofolate synthase [Mesonia hippocampi]|uniref:bifunctional folylpolyglutamate synthase/dihydrofolate synthase n=1 Tax=Mesonia hippocampi TaxID=1628250 RepID=UPI003F97DECA